MPGSNPFQDLHRQFLRSAPLLASVLEVPTSYLDTYTDISEFVLGFPQYLSVNDCQVAWNRPWPLLVTNSLPTYHVTSARFIFTIVVQWCIHRLPWSYVTLCATSSWPSRGIFRVLIGWTSSSVSLSTNFSWIAHACTASMSKCYLRQFLTFPSFSSVSQRQWTFHWHKWYSKCVVHGSQCRDCAEG